MTTTYTVDNWNLQIWKTKGLAKRNAICSLLFAKHTFFFISYIHFFQFWSTYTGYRMSYPIVHSPRSSDRSQLGIVMSCTVYSVQMKWEQKGLWSQDTFQFHNHRPKLHTPNVNQTTQMRHTERERCSTHT